MIAQIPIVWELFLNQAQDDFESSTKRYESAKAKYKVEIEKWQKKHSNQSGSSAPKSTQKGKKNDGSDKPKEPKEPKLRMHKDEPTNFLRLAASLKVIMGSSVKHDMLGRALCHLQDYLIKFREVISFSLHLTENLMCLTLQIYGEKAIKPNHHYAVHIGDQIRDFGPVYTFWTFLTERLNKILKNTNTNNWSGGQVEISMMRQFSRDARQEGMVRAILCFKFI